MPPFFVRTSVILERYEDIRSKRISGWSFSESVVNPAISEKRMLSLLDSPPRLIGFPDSAISSTTRPST